MYSNKENVNILTALLVKHGIRHAVVCPGSRNAPIVHNFNECPGVHCHPVTDERSAGFYALGMAQATGQPVVVCVTSGTALLNLAPAVAEAYYQHRPLVVVSADRPPQWIDQQDGQTLPQPDALGRFVKKAVSLPEPRDDEERWYCNRLVNEALLTACYSSAPVHINLPISEPLFSFTCGNLPDERVVGFVDQANNMDAIAFELGEKFMKARRPMIVIGQQDSDVFLDVDSYRRIADYAVVLHEPLSDLPDPSHFDEVLFAAGEDNDALKPDFVLCMGDVLVSKRLKRFLRSCVGAYFAVADWEGRLADTFCHLQLLVKAHWADVMDLLASCIAERASKPTAFHDVWKDALSRAALCAEAYVPPYSQMAAVKLLESRLKFAVEKWSVHYANSTAIRLANVYARHHVYCNRGVNGIEGSLSTAAGFSCVADERVCCVIGDLSFFYDQNALWNQNLRGNLRILLLNNGRGGIFNMLQGLEQSPARDALVAASHDTTAEGVCRQNHVGYRLATDMAAMQQGMEWLLQTKSEHPLLLEVLTDAGADEQAYRAYYRRQKG